MNRKTFEQQVKKQQKELGLDKWLIVFKYEVERKDDGRLILMSVDRHHLQDSCIWNTHPCVVGEAEFPESNEASFDLSVLYTKTIYHELLHLAVRDLTEIGKMIMAQLSATAEDIADDSWERAEEQFIDRLAVALTARSLSE